MLVIHLDMPIFLFCVNFNVNFSLVNVNLSLVNDTLYSDNMRFMFLSLLLCYFCFLWGGFMKLLMKSTSSFVLQSVFLIFYFIYESLLLTFLCYL